MSNPVIESEHVYRQNSFELTKEPENVEVRAQPPSINKSPSLHPRADTHSSDSGHGISKTSDEAGLTMVGNPSPPDPASPYKAQETTTCHSEGSQVGTHTTKDLTLNPTSETVNSETPVPQRKILQVPIRLSNKRSGPSTDSTTANVDKTNPNNTLETPMPEPTGIDSDEPKQQAPPKPKKRRALSPSPDLSEREIKKPRFQTYYPLAHADPFVIESSDPCELEDLHAGLVGDFFDRDWRRCKTVKDYHDFLMLRLCNAHTLSRAVDRKKLENAGLKSRLSCMQHFDELKEVLEKTRHEDGDQWPEEREKQKYARYYLRWILAELDQCAAHLRQIWFTKAGQKVPSNYADFARMMTLVEASAYFD
ncbi:hypothetical protein BJ508DRAFT_310608 [Ascobolus immersus RN42]|uniref:Uncharacterized protein n=1 Tax=Ascobolus immersus RN42 TaxID=1160509 RepID=A0A3N4HYD5_ASCIM|nr:hypothetical protein BJ508DRAFT_310608 [Ascobolus immersus RN42]